MSVYHNSNYHHESNSFLESEETERARNKIILMCERGFSSQGLKLIKIVEEVPATLLDKKYSADLGILLSTKDYAFQYFFIIEIDGIVGHGTKITSIKEFERDIKFETMLGVITIRIPLHHLKEIETFEQAREYFETQIWIPFFDAYISDEGTAKLAEMDPKVKFNTELACFLADNTRTRCSKCNHLNNDHDLTGCDFRFTENKNKRCDCANPFLRSEK